MSIEKAKLQQYVDRVKSLVVDAQKAKGFWQVVKALPVLAKAAVNIAEDAGKELNIYGADKKELALDIVFAYVELPWWIPEAPVRMFAGTLIEKAVSAFNAKLGK